MDIATAQEAAKLANEIQALEASMAAYTAELDAGSPIVMGTLTVLNEKEGGAKTLSIPSMPLDRSQEFIGAILKTLGARLDVVAGQLAAL